MASKYKKNNDDKQGILIRELKPPKEIFRIIRNYLAGQFVGATRDDALLDEVLKCLFCKLVIENETSDPLQFEDNSFTLAKQIRSTFTKVRALFPEIYDAESEILLDPEALKFVMNELNFSIMDANSDPIGDAFEVFVGSESRGMAGQFFTPRSVTNLLVEALEPKPGETVLDPACGAGGFLASVCAHFVRKNVKQQEIIKTVSKNIFGIDKDNYLAKLAKAHIALLTGAHPQIICGDSLSMQNGKDSIQNYVPKEGVDIILTNPPFGAKIIAAKPEILQKFDLAKRWVKDFQFGKLQPTNEIQTNVPPQVLFIERCISLLRPGGRLGMVLPESVLSNKSYRYVVEYILSHTNLHAIMGMPEALFKTSGKGGTHTKTCLLVATKKGKAIKETPVIFMAEAKWCGQDSRARIIPHNDLPQIAQNFLDFKSKKLNKESNLGFSLEKEKISGNVLCPRYYDPQAEEELNKLEKTHQLVSFKQLVQDQVLTVSTGDEIGKLAYGTGNIPFIRTSDISNWELKADPKHGVSREIFQSLSSKQDVKSGDILMVKDGTYLIGTCAIVTNHDKEILYQSHLYKIRVSADNRFGINPYLLLAILSSSTVQRQIKSKQFTQDIIDSLGERINELVLPIPKSLKLREQITKLVLNAVNHRIEARELVQQARSCFAA